MAQTVKNLPEMWEAEFDSWIEKISWRREWLPTPVFLPGEFQGQEHGELQTMGLQRVRYN